MKLVSAFGAGLVIAVILGFLRPLSKPVCRTGDMTMGVGTTKAKELIGFSGDWIRNARECRVGDYVVYGPDRDGYPEIMLSRAGRPFLLLSNNATTLFDADGQRVLYQWDRGTSVISYDGYDPKQHAWIENLDFHADGTIDFRTSEISGQPTKQELRIGNRWLEFVKRNGTSGVLLDGRFMSADEARKALAAAGNPIE